MTDAEKATRNNQIENDRIPKWKWNVLDSEQLGKPLYLSKSKPKVVGRVPAKRTEESEIIRLAKSSGKNFLKELVLNLL